MNCVTIALEIRTRNAMASNPPAGDITGSDAVTLVIRRNNSLTPLSTHG